MIISRAPLRISFFGGGTDYPAYFRRHGGAVLGSAIDQYSFVTASHSRSRGLVDYSIRLSYREIEHVSSLDEIKHIPIREALRCCGFDCDIELHHIADLPAKTGLGSSSSFSTALLQALRAAKGQALQGLELAYAAIDFERNVLGESVGCQDQTFAAVGGLNMLVFRREDDISVHPVRLPPARLMELEGHLMMFYTGITRMAEEVVKKQFTKADDNRERYARMRRQVDAAHEILTGNGSLASFGEMLHQAWQEKRALHSVISNNVVDSMYERGCEAGALGGKLLGAGGGGFLLMFVPPERQAAVAAALSEHHLLRPRLAAPGATVIFDGSKARAPVAELRKIIG